MADRTVKRQPFSVPIRQTKDGFFNHTIFKGLCDNKNDVSIDPETFADVNNIFVDESNILTSRPPLKFFDGEAYIIDQWIFGNIGLRLHRTQTTATYTDTGLPVLDDWGQPVPFFLFVLRCITHETVDSPSQGIYGEMQWLIPVSTMGDDFIPKVTHVQIEDKIYTWFAGIDFICFNTAGIYLSEYGQSFPYFESALKYLYFPIHKLVINGIESDLETKNFLTETYKRRHQYSAMSSVNFEKLISRQMSVNLNSIETQNKSKHLYDIIVQKNQDKMLVYPYSPIGNNYHIDIVQTSRATVIMRYSISLHIIEISFDGKFFRPLPILENIIGNPQLTKDGMWVVAFTTKGLAKCRLVAQEIADFIDVERVFKWVIDPYMRNILVNGFPGYLEELDVGFIPTGHFETIDQYAYIFSGPSIYSNISGTVQYVYAEWLSGANDIIWGHRALIDFGETTYVPILTTDNIKVHFRYVAPTIDHQDLASVVSIMTPELRSLNENEEVTYKQDCVLNIFFTQSNENVNRTLRNNDRLFISEILGNSRSEEPTGKMAYVHKLSAGTAKDVVADETTIYSNDIISFTAMPMSVSITDDWSSTKEYSLGEVVTWQGFVYHCGRENSNQQPRTSGVDNLTYWRPFTYIQGGVEHYYNSYFAFNYTVGSTPYIARFSWKMAYLIRNIGTRFRIEKTDGSVGAIQPNDRIRITTLDIDVVYTVKDLTDIFGEFPKDTTDPNPTTWGSFSQSWNIPRLSPPNIYTGNSIITGVENTAEVSRILIFNMGVNANIDGDLYTSLGFGMPCNQMDIHIITPKIDADTINYNFIAGYSILGENSSGVRRLFDCFLNVNYDYVSDTYSQEEKTLQIILGSSRWFKILPNSKTILTDVYLRIDDELISLPQNGELSKIIDDNERNASNNDNLVLGLSEDADSQIMIYDSNIHRLTDDGISLSSAQIQSGDIVSYTKNAINETDYLRPGGFAGTMLAPIGVASNRFIIQKLAVNQDGDWVALSGGIKIGDSVRLLAYNEIITLPVGNPGNPFNIPLPIQPWVYPSAPEGWTIGDPWPANFPTYPPIKADAQGNIIFWHPGDPLPIGPIQLFGITNLVKRIRPISIDNNGVWYSIDGTLWTSQLSSENIVELDEYINCETIENRDEQGNIVSRTRVVDFRNDIPDYSAILNEHFISFVTRQGNLNLLQVTSVRRDENKIFTDEGRDFLLYLPKDNEQQFSKKITNLHTLSNNEMGIFTQDEIWYIQAVNINNIMTYTKPVKSKIPVGCRDGSDIITALDGQLIVFTSPRGVTALSPQDFVATTEQTITYLSDNIQEKYQSFYNDVIRNAMFMPDEFDRVYRPIIKITTYKYWVLFYRYMDKTILAFDTRGGSWWVWTTPYPIKSLMVGTRLHILMQIDFSRLINNAIIWPPPKPSLLGVSFVWADYEVARVDIPAVPSFLNETPISNIGYYDDIIEDAINGDIEWVDEEKNGGGRRRVFYPDPIIKWHIMSQRIHFNEINNYKLVKALNMSAKGDTTQTAKISTKVFRDFYHPEKSEVTEIKINDLRTFVQRLNLMHIVNFQYKLETDIGNEQQSQLRLNSLSIKYELKERIR